MAKNEKRDLHVVDGEQDAEVLFLKGYSDIPPPSVPLGKAARDIYDSYCRMMLKRGLLTIPNHEHAENYAIGKDMVVKAYAAGKAPQRYATEMMRAAKMKLDKLGLNDEIHSPVRQGESPYQRFGFAKRARQARNS